MRRCLELAACGRGKTGINPLVGAVLVRDGVIIAEGFHEGFGKAHAERQLLEEFDPTSPRAAGLRGASQEIRSDDMLYVNLEPCCHVGKKTPPCLQLLLERGIKNVVYGMRDPNPEVSGKGINLLIKKGVQVFGPILEDECLRLNRGFVSVMTKHRPWITLKEARTIDGRIANEDGSHMQITTQQQDQWSHSFLRARHDAILVGSGTIHFDNPRLNIRGIDAPPLLRRIILDSAFTMPLSATVVGDKNAASTFVIRGEMEPTEDTIERQRVLEGRGVTICTLPLKEGQFDWPKLWETLITPMENFPGISSILVEGGPKTWAAFRSANYVDEEVTLVGGH